MIETIDISKFVGNHVPPYIYGRTFIPGETVVAYSGPYWDQEEVKAAIDAFVNGDWIASGKRVAEFEKAFSDKFHAKYSLMVNSGSSANLVMMSAIKKHYGWHDGDEIIVSPVGFPTTISVIAQSGLVPEFIDIEWDTLNFDLNLLQQRITARTKAVFLSPVLGNPPDMDRLMEICRINHILLILDNCDSLGSKWNGKYLSEYAVAQSNSFYAAHHISTGHGGMVCTSDPRLMKVMRSIASWGRDCHCTGIENMSRHGSCGGRFGKWLGSYDGIVDHKYVFTNMGYNLQPLDLQGAIGLVQLSKFDEIERKRKVAKEAITEIVLDNTTGVKGVKTFKKADVCWFGTPFICDTAELKKDLVQHLESHKIQTRNYFSGNILMHEGYRHLGNYRAYPKANEVLSRVLFIGAAPHYSEEVFAYISEVIKKFRR
jgi:CDP-4-dehydro-6-deoxyglucose reductase, E1